jgi:hypothetical protein
MYKKSVRINTHWIEIVRSRQRDKREYKTMNGQAIQMTTWGHPLAAMAVGGCSGHCRVYL